MDKTTDMPTVMDDAVTFEAVYDRYFDPVFRFVTYRTGNREVAKDLTSDIFLKVYKKFSAYDPNKGSFEVWLYTIAGNRVKDYYRKKNRFQWLPMTAAKDVAEDDPTTEERMENKEEIAYLRCAVKKLKPRDQLLISYKFGAELSNKTIAELMDTNPNHVGVMIHRLLNQLRKEMEAYYE